MIPIDSIKIPYTTSPHMTRWDGSIFTPIDSFTKLLKLQELEQWGSDLHSTTHEATSNLLVQKLSTKILDRQIFDIVELALLIEEDVAILQDGKLVAICFCFPSGWIPADRIGLTLAEIHHPVADNSRLVLASQKIAEAMATGSPFRRYVWTLNGDGDASYHPEKVRQVPTSIDDLYFRTETQTTLPFGDGRTSAFFVKVENTKYSDLPQEYKMRIKDSINSMTDAILGYKHLVSIKNLLKENGNE